MEKKTTDKSGNGWLVASLLFFLLGLIFLGIFAYGKYQQIQAQKYFQELALQTTLNADEYTPRTVLEQIAEAIAKEELQNRDFGEDTQEQEKKDSIEVLRELGVPVPEDKAVNFEQLKRDVNADIYAWIYVPGTNIDYPVLRHPSDNAFYLNHNLDGSSGYPGCIYTESYNSMEWTDPVTLVYGHDMRSTDTMFHQLHKFTKADFFQENQYIYLYTEDGLLAYRIFATEAHSDEHLLLNHDFSNTAAFQAYFDSLLNGGKETLIREGAQVKEDDRIVVLSTCIRNRADERRLVYGVLLNKQ